MNALHKFFYNIKYIYISYKSYKIKVQNMKFAALTNKPRTYASISFNANIQAKNVTLIRVHKSD